MPCKYYIKGRYPKQWTNQSNLIRNSIYLKCLIEGNLIIELLALYFYIDLLAIKPSNGTNVSEQIKFPTGTVLFPSL